MFNIGIIKKKAGRLTVNEVNFMDIMKIFSDNRNYLEDFITRATYDSNALEGSTLTKNETYALIFDSNHCVINANAKEIHQAINMKKAYKEMFDLIRSKKPLTHDFLVHLNEVINENILFGGAYRVNPAMLTGSNKVFPSPDEIESFLDRFIDAYNALVDAGFTMNDVADLHIHFENIHPFSDGNGRTGRLLINALLLSGNQIPITLPLDVRNDYLKLLETNNTAQMARMFTELQEQEKDRLELFAPLEETVETVETAEVEEA